LVAQYLDGRVPTPSLSAASSRSLAARCLETAYKVKANVLEFRTFEAVSDVSELLVEANRYISSHAPWAILKKGGDTAMAQESLYVILETLRIASSLLSPVMPEKTIEALRRIGWHSPPTFEDAVTWGMLSGGTLVSTGEPLFKRYAQQSSK
jgi:methionyl-tRNA synthetase